MIGWLYRMIVGHFDVHQHKWEIIATETVVDEFSGSKWTRYLLQCKECGDVKSADMKPKT